MGSSNLTDIFNVSVFNQSVVTDGFDFKINESKQFSTYTVVAYIFGTIIFMSNVTVVISSGLILKKGQKLKSTYLLLGNVSLADTIIGVSVMFGVSIDDLMSNNRLCVFQIGMLVCPAMVSIFSVGLIAVDRYIYILHGLYYKRWFNTTKVRIGILCIWLIGITLGFLPATGWVNREMEHSRCYYVTLFPGALILLNSLLSIIPIIVVAVLYSIILVRALKNVKQINAAVKTVQINANSKPELRIYRGNTNMKKNVQSVKYPTNKNNGKIQRSMSFSGSCNKDNSNCNRFRHKSNSIDEISDNQKYSRNLEYDTSHNSIVKSESNLTICTISSSIPEKSDFVSNRKTHVKTNGTNQETKQQINKRKVKEPNKWRAIIVVMLTSGSFIFTWMPYFITVIFFVFCKEKLTNPHTLVEKMVRAIAYLLLFATAVLAKHEQYEGHLLYQLSGPSEDIASLEGRLDILSATPAHRSESKKLEALVRLSPEEELEWLPFFEKNQIGYKLVSNNLASILRHEEFQNAQARNAADRNSTITWDAYYNSETINKYLDEIGAKYPDIATVINAGLSYEGRQIKYLRISTTRFENLRKPVIVIDAAAHAREWVTPPVALYLIQQLVERRESDLTDLIDWIIIPMVNPDGYEYTLNENRLWRKTRSRSHEGSDECPGVDINRNFDIGWGTVAANSNPCSIIFEGPSVFSEPETRIVRDAVYSNLERTYLYISLHSFGNMFLYAWGNGSLPSNALSLHVAGIQMATAIDKLKLDKAPYYVVGNAANVLYFTTGTSRDWTRLVGIPLTYTMELPGYEYQFVVPPSYIRQIITESWAGFVAGARYVLSIR
ncbi:uncharacterized protein LOC112044377 [Bicyclus anynana]|uniref:Uncharacterized protein LOC112044377 n=1 Tax=Bicyclus anynana TaxID=110368 RepID=A0A6J1MZG8_BICAN|nr:uncharacterized protein LOC112044377 [Bicyclus anynana]